MALGITTKFRPTDGPMHGAVIFYNLSPVCTGDSR